MAAPNLDDLLSEVPIKGEAESVDPDDAEGDEFTMHAEDFLNDALPMDERVEALRNAIKACEASDEAGEEY